MDCTEEPRRTLEQLKGGRTKGQRIKHTGVRIVGNEKWSGCIIQLRGQTSYTSFGHTSFLGTGFVCAPSCPLSISKRIPMVNIPQCNSHFHALLKLKKKKIQQFSLVPTKKDLETISFKVLPDLVRASLSNPVSPSSSGFL